MKKFYKIKNDSMFKAIFCKEENQDLLERLIYECTNLKVKIISLEIPEQIKRNIYNKNRILDVIAKTNDEEFNIEVNTYENSSLRRRNASYIFKRYTDGINKGETYYDMLKYIQINITSNLNQDDPLISKYILKDENNRNFIDNLEIYEINLKKTINMCYNKNETSILSMLNMNEEQLLNSKGDNLVEKLKKEAIKLNYIETAPEFLSPEEEDRLFINTIKEDARNEGLKEGNLEGINKEKQNIAKKLLEKNSDINFIMELTGLTSEEIKNLK